MSELKNLRTFLEEIKNEIIHIKEPLSRRYEIAAALRKFDGGKAVLVKEKVTGVTVVGGVNGNRPRLLKSIDVTPDNLYPVLIEATKNPLKCEVGDGPVKEVVEEGDLSNIPILTHFKGDPGPYVTSGILHTKGPNGEHENVSFHRLLVLDKNRMAIRIVPRHLFRITQIARDQGKKSLDVAISIGHHPATLMASAMPASFGTSEFDIANRLLGGSLTLTETAISMA